MAYHDIAGTIEGVNDATQFAAARHVLGADADVVTAAAAVAMADKANKGSARPAEMTASSMGVGVLLGIGLIIWGITGFKGI